ncbi:MAG: lactate racemase domain-containing protein [Bacteroidales bacterium]|nr:lactate racemase domain-containing protein [Bacteroidales bacterium]
MLYYRIESEDRPIESEQIRKALIASIESAGQGKAILIIPPDITRINSGAGIISEIIWKEAGKMVKDILPALGTHKPMTDSEISLMYGAVPHKLFRLHNCHRDIITLGKIPGSYIKEATGDKLNYDWPVQVNKHIIDHAQSLIISIGQVVPHEVTGMSSYNKNIFIGCGGYEAINKSHFLSAVYGIENLMGRAVNPVRELINRGESLFAGQLNILYVLTVIDKGPDGSPAMKGLFIGSDIECFMKASALSSRLNLTFVEKEPAKMVVYLNPLEYRSTWLGNKAIYRTRMAIADGGELVIIAPGIREFGEDKTIDRLIRKYGYRTPAEILQLVNENADLRENLGAAAHLIHGSPDKRFKVTYCTGHLPEKDILNAGFAYAGIEETKDKFNTENLREGFNINRDGEEFYYIPNPGLGLWSTREKINAQADNENNYR